MATTKAKATTAKKTTAKPAAKKTAAPKKTPAKKTVSKKATKARSIGGEERYRMIEVAAYYIAERNNFKGSSTDYWIAAEAEIAKVIGK
jgi:hypothetical protein